MSQVPSQVPVSVRLVSTDFDGTIHEDHVRPSIPAALQKKFSSLQKAGVTWVINTGRDMASLMHSLEQTDIRVRPDYVVLVEREIFRHVGASKYEPVEPWNSNCTSDHSGLFRILGPQVARLKAQLTESHDAHFYEDVYSPLCAVAQDNLQMDEIERTVRVSLRPFPSTQIVRNSVYLRLAHRGYSKGTALAELQRILGVTAEHTVVAGDHLNDLPMLDPAYARYMISPHNSVPPVRTQVQLHGGYLARKPAGQGTLEGLLALGM